MSKRLMPILIRWRRKLSTWIICKQIQAEKEKWVMKQLQETQITMIILMLLQNLINKATLERSLHLHKWMNLMLVVSKEDTPVEESRASITKILELKKLTRMMVPSL